MHLSYICRDAAKALSLSGQSAGTTNRTPGSLHINPTHIWTSRQPFLSADPGNSVLGAEPPPPSHIQVSPSAPLRVVWDTKQQKRKKTPRLHMPNRRLQVHTLPRNPYPNTDSIEGTFSSLAALNEHSATSSVKMQHWLCQSSPKTLQHMTPDDWSHTTPCHPPI